MLTFDEAKALATKEILEMPGGGESLMIIDRHTVAKPYGWVFFFNTRKYEETKNFIHGLFGNGPIVVRHNKRIYHLPTAGGVDDIIATFEKKHGLRAT